MPRYNVNIFREGRAVFEDIEATGPEDACEKAEAAFCTSRHRSIEDNDATLAYWVDPLNESGDAVFEEGESVNGMGQVYDGVHCPHCRSDDIEGGRVNMDAKSASQAVKCLACGATWDDVYTLSHYESLERPTAS
jgi:DNA-directed RNA polymerase subunit RPC12/RpoP